MRIDENTKEVGGAGSGWSCECLCVPVSLFVCVCACVYSWKTYRTELLMVCQP